MFGEKAREQLAHPFDIVVYRGGCWLTRLSSRPVSGAMAAFLDWLLDEAKRGVAGRGDRG